MSGAGEKKVRRDDDFLAGLVKDLEPVKPVRLLRSIAMAIALELGVVFLTAWILGARIVAAERMLDPVFAGLLVVLGGAAVASAVAMTTLAIPGRSVPARTRMLLLAVPLLLSLFVVAFSPWGGSWTGFSAVFLEGFGCTRNTLLVAVPAWIAGLLLLRRLGPLDASSAGLFCASSALLASSFVVQMACPHCESWHLAISHYLPVVVAAWIGALLSPLLLARR